jgi:uncharacterized protein involved in exopolysaccharide biosynthesis
MNTAANPSVFGGQDAEGAPLGPAIGDYLTVVTRRAGTILLPFAVVTLAAVGVAFMLPPQFNERTTFKIEDPEVVASFYQSIGLSVPHKQIISTIKADVSAISFLAPLVEACGINEGLNPRDKRDAEELMKIVRGNLSIDVSPQKVGPDLVSFAYTGRDAYKVARFVNMIRDKYQEEFLDKYRNDVLNAFATVKRQHDAAKTTYDTTARDLESFQTTHGHLFAGDTSDVPSRLRDSLAKHEIDVTQFEGDLEAEKRAFADASGKLSEVSPVRKGASTKAMSDAYRAQLAEVKRLETLVANLSEKKTEVHPDVKAARFGLEKARNTLAQMEQFDVTDVKEEPNPAYDALVQQKATAESRIKSLEARLTNSKAAITEATRLLKELPEKLKRSSELQVAHGAASDLWQTVQKRYAVALATKDRVLGKETSFFTLLDQPLPEEAKFRDPVSPNIPLFIGVGAFVGLALGGALAFGREFATAAFTTPNQVRYGLRLPVLGEIAALTTAAEAGARRRKRALVATVVVVLLAALGWCHVAYFTKAYRDTLPKPVFDVMRRIYGKG